MYSLLTLLVMETSYEYYSLIMQVALNIQKFDKNWMIFYWL